METCGVWSHSRAADHHREETAGAIEIGVGGPRRRPKGRVDYVLRVKVTLDSQPVAVDLIEAKAKLYAACKRLNVPFVFSSNGHLFVEFDRLTGLTSQPRALAEFPAPADLRRRYEERAGFQLDSIAARPLLARYTGGEATRRYYQDAAIRTVLEKLARGEKRALLALDSQDRPHISYYDQTNGDLKYSRWSGSQWVIETADSAGIVQPMLNDHFGVGLPQRALETGTGEQREFRTDVLFAQDR